MAVETGLAGNVLEVGGENRYYLSLILDPWIIDYEGGPRRPVLEDVRRHTILGESLPRVSSMMRMEYPVTDIPGPDSYLKTMEVFLSNTTKHTAAYPTSEENCRLWIEAMSAIAAAAGLDAAAPLLSIAMAVTSPLQIGGPNVEIMKMAIAAHAPIISTVCPMAGTTAPYSVAGTLLLSNVEALAPVLIAQLYEPGHPVMYGFGPSVADMKSSHDLYYKVEKMLFKTAATQLGRFYRLPVSGEAGGTLTWRPDMQNGAESMAYLLASVAGGQNVIGGLGSLHNANGMSAEQIVMQCGLVDMAEYLARGLRADETRLAYQSILRTGPGGNFLTDDLTLEMLRTDEFFRSPYLDLTGGYPPGARSMYAIARETVEELVSAYCCRVPGNVLEAIERFFAPRYQER
jgi:trimethylamine--corrinoid protein Co-methyltransferase